MEEREYVSELSRLVKITRAKLEERSLVIAELDAAEAEANRLHRAYTDYCNANYKPLKDQLRQLEAEIAGNQSITMNLFIDQELSNRHPHERS